MAKEDLSWIGITVRRLVRVSDADVKDCSLATGPKAMDSMITTEFRGRFCAVGDFHWYVRTGLDEGFVGNGGWCMGLAAKLAPSSHKVIVTMDDETPFSAGHGMFSGETVATSIAVGGKCKYCMSNVCTDILVCTYLYR